MDQQAEFAAQVIAADPQRHDAVDLLVREKRVLVNLQLVTRTLFPAATTGTAPSVLAQGGFDTYLDRALFTAAGQRLLGRAARVEREPVTSAGGLLEEVLTSLPLQR